MDTGIEEITSSDEAAIENVLKDSTYIWVLPIDMGEIYYKITYSTPSGIKPEVADGLASGANPEISDTLTGEEKQTSAKSGGDWSISEIGEYSIGAYSDILSGKLEGTLIDRAVLIGGIPGFSMPVALGFRDGETAAWISLGFGSEILDSIPQINSDANGIYDYFTVFRKMNEYESDDRAAGKNSRELLALFIGIGAFILLLFAAGAVLVIHKKKAKRR